MEIPSSSDSQASIQFYQINVEPSSSGEQMPDEMQAVPIIDLVESDENYEGDEDFTDYPDNDEFFEVRPGDPEPVSPARPANPREYITSAHTDIEREFMHIVIKSGVDLYDCNKQIAKENSSFSSTHEGPFATKWTVHFYPWGHPQSNYSNLLLPGGILDEQKSASLYVRLQASPTDVVEARITATVVHSQEKAEAVVKTSMDNLMLCPRNKIDEFQRGTSGHGWPKISSVKDLRNHQEGFCLVVTLQIVKPEATFAGPRHNAVFQARPTHIKRTQARYHLQQSHMYCDAFLQATDWQWVPAHRFILASASEYFRKLFQEDHGAPFVHKTNHTIEELKALLDILYQGKIPARTFDQSTKLRELTFPYGVDFVRPVFLNDVIEHHQKNGGTPCYRVISEESFDY